MWRHSATFGSASGSSSQPRGTTEDSRPAVRESPDAKSVTSTPRSTRPSVSSDANCSQGP